MPRTLKEEDFCFISTKFVCSGLEEKEINLSVHKSWKSLDWLWVPHGTGLHWLKPGILSWLSFRPLEHVL